MAVSLTEIWKGIKVLRKYSKSCFGHIELEVSVNTCDAKQGVGYLVCTQKVVLDGDVILEWYLKPWEFPQLWLERGSS